MSYVPVTPGSYDIYIYIYLYIWRDTLLTLFVWIRFARTKNTANRKPRKRSEKRRSSRDGVPSPRSCWSEIILRGNISRRTKNNRLLLWLPRLRRALPCRQHLLEPLLQPPLRLGCPSKNWSNRINMRTSSRRLASMKNRDYGYASVRCVPWPSLLRKCEHTERQHGLHPLNATGEHPSKRHLLNLGRRDSLLESG